MTEPQQEPRRSAPKAGGRAAYQSPAWSSLPPTEPWTCRPTGTREKMHDDGSDLAMVINSIMAATVNRYTRFLIESHGVLTSDTRHGRNTGSAPAEKPLSF